MKLFRGKSFEEKVKKALDSYRAEAVRQLFPAGFPEAKQIVSDLAELCELQPERCSVAQCEELLDLYAEVANGTETGANREMKVVLLRKKYGTIVTGFAMADRICNYCEHHQENEQTASEPEETVNEEPEDQELVRVIRALELQTPDSEQEIPENDLKALAVRLTEDYDLGGKERKKALETLKPERKRAIREALDKASDDAKTAIEMTFAAGCTASGGKSCQTEAELRLPGAILTGTRAEENWTELDEDEKKAILKLAWQMGVRAGIRKKDTEDPEESV